MNRYQCMVCKCYWRRNDDGTWSLYDDHQKPEQCCDNSPDFLAKIIPAPDLREKIARDPDTEPPFSGTDFRWAKP